MKTKWQPNVPANDVLDILAALPQGWDSYGALPINPNAIAAARDLVRRFPDLEQWHIIPTNTGGVQFEWAKNGIYLEIEIVRPWPSLSCFASGPWGEDMGMLWFDDTKKIKELIRKGEQ